MVDVVDSIVAELIIRDVDKYEAGFDRATAAHKRFRQSTQELQRQTFDLAAEGRKYKAGADAIAQGQEQSDQRVTRSRKKRAADAKATDEAEVASAKKAAREKSDAEIAEAQRSARLRAAVEKGVGRSSVRPGSGANLGRTVPREGDGSRAFLNATTVGGATAEANGKVAAEKEVNHLLADQATLQARLATAKGTERETIREQLADLRLIRSLERAGIADDEIALRLEQRRAAVAAQRTTSTRAGLLSSSTMRGSAGGGGNALLGAAIGAGVAIAAVESATNYGKALKNLSDQLGITTDDLQAYIRMARDAGVSQEILSSAFGQFASNLGRAQQGQKEYAKVFSALGISIKDFKSAGDALPTVIDRISQLKDPLQRAAIETRLFGEEGRKLDPLLSQGAAGVSELARSLLATGQALSAQEIKELDDTARKLAAVKAELQVDLSRVVAGNANAIEFLVGKFLRLADTALKAVNALRIFANQSLSVDEKNKQIALLTPQGRSQYLRQNERQQDEIRAKLNGNGRRGRVVINGEDVSNNPATIAAQNGQYQRQLRDLANQHREVRTGGAGGTQPTAPTPPVQTGAVNLPAIGRLGAPDPRKPRGKSAEQQAREAEERTKRFNDQLAQAEADLLRAQQDLTGSVDERAKIEQQLLKRAYDARLADIESDRKRNVLAGADAKLEEARSGELKAAEKKAFDTQSSAIEQDRRLGIERTLTERTQNLLDAQGATLSVQLSLAKTAAERRRIELQLLENQKAQERNRLNGVISSSKPGDAAADEARAQLGTLDQRYGDQRRVTEQSTRGPLQEALDGLPRTAEQVDEALQNAAVNGLQSLNDGLTDAVKNFLHLNGIAGDFLGQLIEIGIQRAVLVPLADKLFPTGDSSSGLLGTLAGLFGGGKKLGGTRAAGGNVVAGVPYLVGEHGPEPVVFGASGRVFPNGALPSIGASGGGAPTIIAPQHFDLTGVVMTEPLLRQFEQRNRDYANAVAAQAARGAITATPGRLQKLDTLGS